MITRIELRNWVMHYGCEIKPLLGAVRGNAVKVFNPKTEGEAYLDMPFDDKPVKCYTVCRVCSLLGIPIPDECKYIEPLDEHIRTNHGKP